MAAAFDYALVGGGLQSGLIALALLDADPTLRLALIERDGALGGNHTWCFHEADVPPAIAAAIAPLVAHRWPEHEVRFPGHARRIAGGYAAVTSARLDAVVRARLAAQGGRLVLGRTAVSLAADGVALDGGERIDARRVIDARGAAGPTGDGAGYQVFLGQEVRLTASHGLARPILMDAEVAQTDGFRFMYVLPLAPDRLLIEDTAFADAAALDAVAHRGRIAAYAAARGWSIAEVAREECGVLPMPWRGGPTPRAGWPLIAGYRGGWFHPATGYSFPIAARLAAALARDPRGGDDGAIVALAEELAGPQRFARALNRLAFRWWAPDQRWRIFERFYRLPESTIARFYALTPTAADCARILVGRPPRGLSLRARIRRAA